MDDPTPDGGRPYQGLVGLLRLHARRQPDEQALLILGRDGHESATLTYRELDIRSRAVAAELQRRTRPGDRALLLFPTGPDFVVSLLACGYAGVVAVPAPETFTGGGRLGGIVEDAAPSVVLTTEDIARQPAAYQVDGIGQTVVPDQVPTALADTFREHRIHPSDEIILQYTSGSTSDPKGVRITHHNVLVNIAQFARTLPLPPGERKHIVSWLPLFHDMGMSQVALSLHYGGLLVLMAPATFVLRPVLWLEAITRYRAQIATAPNFGYDMCVQRVTTQQRDGLDLSSWRCALNGSEPVRAETLERFGKEFAEVGFDPRALMPCYGLAEGTFFVSGAPGASRTLEVSVPALERTAVVRAPRDDEPGRGAVTVGPMVPEIDVRIVDPESRQEREPGMAGEIWLAGESISPGYWRRCDDRFGARIEGGPDGTAYLRTKDLGFIHDDELFILSRLDDVILLDGRNHFPQDIELTTARSHQAVATGRVIAFGYPQGERTVVAVVAETDRQVPIAKPGEPVAAGQVEGAQIVRRIRSAVTAEHQIPVASVVLLRPGSLPRTTSGKVQRRRCRDLFLADELKTWW